MTELNPTSSKIILNTDKLNTPTKRQRFSEKTKGRFNHKLFKLMLIFKDTENKLKMKGWKKIYETQTKH